MIEEVEEAEGIATPNGIHMIRTAQQIHVSLSQMADQKASILMGATFVIFTITISQAKGGHLPTPLLILGAGAFCAAVLAILAILPATRVRTDGPINLLFFGSFTRISEQAFANALLNEMTADRDIYRLMVHDLYQNGLVLARKKYRFLGYAYRVFLVALTLSFIAFIVEWLPTVR